ncbi:hypothetical protein KKC60_01870 [Patescibacteria group bacterium]|nr:hypothetical protein [Patescibacteria group bacterium]
MRRNHSQSKQSGQVALIAILIVSAAVLVVSLAVSSLGLNEMLMGFEGQQSERAFQIADTCADEGVLRLRRVYDGEEASYSGGTLTFGSDSCTIAVTVAGSNRILDVTSTVNSKINRKIQTVVQVSPSFQVLSWQEQP